MMMISNTRSRQQNFPPFTYIMTTPASHQLYQRYGGGKVVPNKKSKAQNLILKQPFKQQLEQENEHEHEHENNPNSDVNAKAMNAIGK